jgi:hypothetical protein
VLWWIGSRTTTFVPDRCGRRGDTELRAKRIWPDIVATVRRVFGASDCDGDRVRRRVCDVVWRAGPGGDRHASLMLGILSTTRRCSPCSSSSGRRSAYFVVAITFLFVALTLLQGLRQPTAGLTR